MKNQRIGLIIIWGLALVYLNGIKALAQNGESWSGAPEVLLTGYLDVFYAYDFNRPETPYRQPFFFNHNRHNEFNLNQALIGVGVNHNRYRASLALQAGTYSNDNYSNEPGVLKNIYEAFVGMALNRKNNLWLDAGIFSSHLGAESALSIDDWTLTRSLSAESSPFFLAGAKVTYTLNEKIEFAGLITNGWQRIQRVEGNSLPSFGTQLIYKAGEKYTFNWSTFIGTDDPDGTRRMRYFNNFFGQFQFSEQFGLLAGFDFGIQQEVKGSSSYDPWFAFTMILQYTFSEKWAAALRAENFLDREGVIIPTDAPDGFNTTGLSINADFRPIPALACRAEARWLISDDDIYTRDGNAVSNDFFIVTSIAYRLHKLIR